MSTRKMKRLINEINELETSSAILENTGIYFHYDENNITILYTMIIGPSNTPYENGFYFFKFEYPENYPMQPPIVKYCTQGSVLSYIDNKLQKIRFNPNLYTCGKVCLSMLNTWSGPGWVPTNTTTNVLVALQALVLNEFPLQNEPGFENSPNEVLNKYSDIVSYSNLDIAVIQMLKKQPSGFEHFKEKMENIFLKNINFYKNKINANIKEEEKEIEKFKKMDAGVYGMKIKSDYKKILDEFCELEIEITKKNLDKMVIS
jgi:ubiquitin-protein ligase